MFAWLPFIPTILNALVQLARLLYDLAKESSGDDIKACSIAIEAARKTGDTAKLTELINKMSKGKPC